MIHWRAARAPVGRYVGLRFDASATEGGFVALQPHPNPGPEKVDRGPACIFWVRPMVLFIYLQVSRCCFRKSRGLHCRRFS